MEAKAGFRNEVSSDPGKRGTCKEFDRPRSAGHSKSKNMLQKKKNEKKFLLSIMPFCLTLNFYINFTIILA